MNSTVPMIMLDVESLGDTPQSVITSIAAVAFEPLTGNILDAFETHISIGNSLALGQEVTASTLMLWLGWDDATRKKLLDGQKSSQPLYGALSQLTNFIANNGARDAYVWGRSPRFDMGILMNAFRVAGIHDIPWDFRKELDVRTIEFLHPEFREVRDTTLYPVHSGIDDCKYQISYVSKILARLNQADKDFWNVARYGLSEDYQNHCGTDAASKA